MDNLPLARLRAVQGGVADRRQLAAAGVGHDKIRTEVRAGRWRLLGPRVVLMSNGGLDRRQRLWAGVLCTGPGAALCGLTVLALAGLPGADDGLVHVVAPAGAHPTSPGPWLSVHLSRRFDPRAETVRLDGLPAVEPARAVLDAAVWARTDPAAERLVRSALAGGLCDTGSLLVQLIQAGEVRRGKLLTRLLLAGVPERAVSRAA